MTFDWLRSLAGTWREALGRPPARKPLAYGMGLWLGPREEDMPPSSAVPKLSPGRKERPPSSNKSARHGPESFSDPGQAA